MYLLFPGASLKIARNLIRVTGTQEIWATLRHQSTSKAPPRHLWREILGLNVCNLAQTMTEGAVDRELDPEDRQDILEDFVMEILRAEKWIPTKDGAERMDLCMEVLMVSERLKPHFSRTRVAQGLKPRQEAVRDLLFSLGMDREVGLQKTLSSLADTQHQRFIDYFKGLFEPFAREDSKEPGPEDKVPSLEKELADFTETVITAGSEERLPAPPLPIVGPVDLDPLTILTEVDASFVPEPLIRTVQEPGLEDPLAERLGSEGSMVPGMGETPIALEKAFVEIVETAPQEAWVEEGAVAEPAVESPPSQESGSFRSPLEFSVQPLTRPRPSFGRSVDPQKLAKVLEYLLSPTDSPPPDMAPEPIPAVNDGMGKGALERMPPADAPGATSSEANGEEGAAEVPPVTEGT